MRSSIYDKACLIPRLQGLDYASVNSLLEHVVEASKGTDQYPLWSLCYVLWKDKNRLHEWLNDTVKSRVSQQSDPYIYALFTNDTDSISKLGAQISPFVPLIFSSKYSKEVSDDVPDFFKNKTFKYQSNIIKGVDVWNLITGNVKPIAQYKLDWLIIFALHFWYCSNTTDVSSALISFSALDIACATTAKEKDPLYKLIDYHSHGLSTIIDAASTMSPLDALFFIRILSILGGQTVDPLSDKCAVDNAARALLKEGLWEFAAGLYHISEQPSKAIAVAEASVSEKSEEAESRLVIEFGFLPAPLSFAKARSVLFKAQIESDDEKRLLLLANSIDLAITAEEFGFAATVLFDLYLPLATELNANTHNDGRKRLIEFSSALKKQHMSGDFEKGALMLSVLSKALNGHLISEVEIVQAAECMESGWGTFAQRLEVCEALIAVSGLQVAYLLRKVDAVPKDKLISAKVE